MTSFYDQKFTNMYLGDCFRTCVANYLIALGYRVPRLEAVPNFYRGYVPTLRSYNRLRRFLLQFGLAPGTYTYEDYSKATGLYIISGKSPRMNCLHSCLGLNGEFFHDPHPDKSFVTEIVDVIYLEPFWYITISREFYAIFFWRIPWRYLNLHGNLKNIWD